MNPTVKVFRIISPLLLVILISITSHSQDNINSNTKDSLITAYKDIAGGYFLKDSLRSAIFYINKAIELDPNSAELYGNRGLFYSYYDQYLDSALNDFNQALIIEFDYPKAHSLRAEILYKKKQFVEAINDYDYLLQNDSMNVDWIFKRAISFTRTEQIGKSIKDYLKIIEIDNQTLSASDYIVLVYNNLGYTYLELGDYDKAQFFINKAIIENPQLSFVWGARGILNYKLGKLDQSLSDLNKSISIFESGNDVSENFRSDLPYYYLGLIQMKKGNKIVSCQSFTKAFQLGNKEAKLEMSKVCGN